ncbi:hypothetical protein [Arthrobacter sp. UYCo732]|uniref:hypothetical protein n=1 Tax=Arthrobacter sp. UYCo732 TaxID=3156336 RepID=UPI00339383F9
MAAETSNPYGVRPGQVWVDQDKRAGGRRVTILTVGETHATVKSVLRTKVRLTRFRPTSTGYRLLQDKP